MPEVRQSLIARERLQVWARLQREDAMSRYADGEQPGLLETTFAILLQEALGKSQPDDLLWTEQAGEAISLAQDEASGHFEFNEILAQDLVWPQTCDRNYIQSQCDYFALSALRAVSLRPQHSLGFLEPFLDRKYVNGWLDAGPWQDPWNMSNRVMFLLRFYLEQKDLVDTSLSDSLMSLFDFVLDYLDDLQDPTTGMWHGIHNAGDMTAAYSAYHFYPFYFFRHRRPRHIEATIEKCLALQSPDGHFSTFSEGGACEDLDVVAILVTHSLVAPHKAEEVKHSLLKAHEAILNIQNTDGGFPNYSFMRNPAPSWKRRVASSVFPSVSKRARMMSFYSGWKKIGAYFGQSDLWGGWFRIFTINLIESRFPELFDERQPNFHEYPCLGWHCQDAVQEPTK